MKSGFKIFWADHALSELKQTIEYLENNWTERELRIFSAKLDHTIELISRSPEIFPSLLEIKGVRKAVIEKYNTLYYRINNENIEIILLFSNRQNPNKREI